MLTVSGRMSKELNKPDDDLVIPTIEKLANQEIDIQVLRWRSRTVVCFAITRRLVVKTDKIITKIGDYA